MKKKVLSILMAGAMALSLAACGGTEGASSAAPTPSSESKAEESKAEESKAEESVADDTAAESTAEVSKDPITFVYYGADCNNDVWDNPVGNAITDATGVTLDIEYPVDSTGDAAQDIALMIANDDYPDLIFAKGECMNLYDAGAYIDMEPYIDQYGPNIKKMYGEEYDKLRWSKTDRGIYQLCYAGVGAKTLKTCGTAALQYQVLKENNWAYPKTIPELEQTVKDYMAAHPKTADGADTIGMSISVTDWHWLITLGNPAGFIATGQPDNGEWLVEKDLTCTFKHMDDRLKEHYRWLNRMYQEGVLDPNFATQTHDDYLAKLAAGQVVCVFDQDWDIGQPMSLLKSENRLDETFCYLPVSESEDIKVGVTTYQGLQAGWGVGITKSCKDPARAVQFLDFLCSDEGEVLYKWGIEGVNYQLDENGMRYRTEDEIAKASSDPDYSKNTGIGNYGGFPIYGDGATDANGNPYTTATRESVIAEYNENEKAACEAWGVESLIDIFPKPEEFDIPNYPPLWAMTMPAEITTKMNTLDDIAQVAIVNMIKDKPENFDKNWDDFMAKLDGEGAVENNQAMTDFLKANAF